MKNLVCLFVLICVVHAQHDQFGVSFSLSASSFQGEDAKHYSFRESVGLGLFYEPSFNEIQLHGELNFTLRGAVYENNVIYYGEKKILFRESILYLDIPILFKKKLTSEFSLLLGPSVSVFLTAFKGSDPNYHIVVENFASPESEPMSVYLSGVAAISYQQEKLSYRLGLNYGFSRLLNIHDIDLQAIDISFSLAYLLGEFE
jgi:hypothetical protein